MYFKKRKERLMKISYISSNEYIFRLVTLHWKIRRNGSHIFAYAPDGIGTVVWSINNWEKNWRRIAKDLLRTSKNKTCGYLDLCFVWKNPFIIPTNFDYKTQSILHTKSVA